MDNVIKSKFIELKEKFNFNLDVKNIKFYQKIKNTFNNAIFLISSSVLSFLLSLWILNGFTVLVGHIIISLIFI
jgi:hypothetical protein